MVTIFATRGVLRRSNNTKIVFGRGSAPDPAGGAYDAPPDPLVGWGGGFSDIDSVTLSYGIKTLAVGFSFRYKARK